MQLGTIAIVTAMSQTWLHPLLKKMLPAQGEVGLGRRWGVVQGLGGSALLACMAWHVAHTQQASGLETVVGESGGGQNGRQLSLVAQLYPCPPQQAAASWNYTGLCPTTPPPPPITSSLQGPTREIMLNGFFKNRVLAWSKEPAGEAPVLVQVGGGGGTCEAQGQAAGTRAIVPGARRRRMRTAAHHQEAAGVRDSSCCPCCPAWDACPPPLQAEVGDPHRDGGYWGTSRMVGAGGAGRASA